VEWKRRGACRDDDLYTFFGLEGERPPARQAREAAAKDICSLCPVIEACLEYALEHDEKAGVWGGLGEEERKAERRRRQRRQSHAATVKQEQAAESHARDLDLLRRSEYLIARGQPLKVAARTMGVPYSSLREARERAQARQVEAS
jgi:WhiB family redox-sensing transcriptional regulator